MSDVFTSPEIQGIISRVEKLLRLAANNPNENEAASAASKAQELLAAHNLDMSTVEARGGDKAKREDTKLRGGLYRWQREVWEEVAKLNYCLYWSIKGMEKGSKYEHRVLGRTVNILSTKLMAEYLEGAIERITRDHYDNDPKVYFAKPAVAFREGMASRICSRLNTRRYEAEQEARRKAAEEKTRQAHPAYAGSTANALTIIDLKQSEADGNNDLLYGYEPGTTARQRAEREAASIAWRAAYEARQAKALAEAEQFQRDHPEEYVRLQAEEAKERARQQKRDERNEKRRKGKWYRSWSPRHSDYYEGQQRGDAVSLDQQVNQSQTRKLT